MDSSDPGRDNSWYVCIRRGVTCDLCNTGTERKRRISCDSGPCMGGAEFFLMVTQFRSGLVGTADIRLICISILPLLIATWLGKKLVCKVSQKVFLNLTYILLLISGVSLIV